MKEVPKHASPEDALAASEDWTDQMLECRTYGHRWRPVVAAYTKDRKAIATSQECDCGCDRTSLLDARSGWILHSEIHYPAGYLLKGLGRVTGDAKGAIRLATVQRVYGVRLRTIRKAS